MHEHSPPSVYSDKAQRSSFDLLVLPSHVLFIYSRHETKVWALELSDLHLKHKSLGFKCTNPIHTVLPKAVAVELACAFAVQTTVTHVNRLDEKYRVQLIAAVVTVLVYAGGSVTGAVFNPALAFSIQFPCSGNTFLEYSLVYCVGPVLGVVISVLLFDKIIPLLSGKSASQKGVDSAGIKDKKTA
ncbi:hypothetical protein SKAU_G00263880 [Synaphobranchus kaupii]|uniref:Aquaporin n=1 Tax=Synaphobranchus kaupii TaxID=118154 RepID=A0A9Q1EYT7_SYNKA|nr:hypothetical protein SKAU_G00263880 [Synaphobranchus kaupii]